MSVNSFIHRSLNELALVQSIVRLSRAENVGTSIAINRWSYSSSISVRNSQAPSKFPWTDAALHLYKMLRFSELGVWPGPAGKVISFQPRLPSTELRNPHAKAFVRHHNNHSCLLIVETAENSLEHPLGEFDAHASYSVAANRQCAA